MIKISVVIPNFKDPRIDRALSSVRNQIFSNIEIIVVHGGPLTIELKNIYEGYLIDKLIIESDKGIFDALNKGVLNATGDVIYLMGSDDYLSDKFVFQDSIKLFDSNPSADGVCMGCVFVNSNGSVIREWFPNKISSKRIKSGIFPPHFSLFLKKEVYQLVGQFKFESSNNVATDIIWLLDFAILKPNFHILNLNNHYLAMEYGGASTGSMKAIIRQFRVVHSYAISNKKHIIFWPIFSVIRSASKLFQFRLFKKINNLYVN